MKRAVQRFFDRQRRHFEPGGRLERAYAFFEAMETVFLAPADTTVQGPQVRDSLDVKRYMASVVFVLLPLLLFGMYNVGHQSRLAAGLAPDFWAAGWHGLQVVLPLVIVQTPSAPASPVPIDVAPSKSSIEAPGSGL